ncbi:MAG TPA: hypothetical protein VFA71_00950 [Terriglobales bacterium]|nr:hypothetical protein [Terriglobales bacterium]
MKEIERSKLIRERAKELRRQAAKICTKSRQLVDCVISSSKVHADTKIRKTPLSMAPRLPHPAFHTPPSNS